MGDTDCFNMHVDVQMGERLRMETGHVGGVQDPLHLFAQKAVVPSCYGRLVHLVMKKCNAK